MTSPRDQQSEPRPEEFALLVDAVQDYAIFMLDPTGHVISWNEGARHIKQYEPAEILGKRARDRGIDLERRQEGVGAEQR